MNANNTSIQTNNSIYEDRVTSMKKPEKATRDEMDHTFDSCSVYKYSCDTIDAENRFQNIEFNLQAATNTAVASPPCQIELENDNSSNHARHVDENFENSSEEIRSGGDVYAVDGKVKKIERASFNGISTENETRYTSGPTVAVASANGSDSEDHQHKGTSKSYKQFNNIGHKKSEIAIQSEQQRLYREADVSIPYYKPKNHSLQEFLRRRTIIQPPSLSKCNTIIKNVQKSNSMKMSTEELKQYAHFLDFRVSEAREFYSSTINGETGGHAKDDEPLITMAHCAISSIQKNDNCSNDNLTANSNIEEAEHTLSKCSEEKSIKTKDLEKQCVLKMQTNSDSSTTSNKNRISLGPIFAQERVRTLLENMELPTKPVVTGEADKFVDLTNGNWIEKSPCRYESLIKRLLSNVKSATLSCETVNSKLEPTKINFELYDNNMSENASCIIKSKETASNYFEMQRNMKILIDKRRQNDLQRKCEQKLNIVNTLKTNSVNDVDVDIDNSEDICNSNDEYNGDTDNEDIYNDVEEMLTNPTKGNTFKADSVTVTNSVNDVDLDTDNSEDNCYSSDEYNSDTDNEDMYNDVEENHINQNKGNTCKPDSVAEIFNKNVSNNDNNGGNYINRHSGSCIDKTDANKINNLNHLQFQPLTSEKISRKRKRIVICPIDDDDDDDENADNKNHKVGEYLNGETQIPVCTQQLPNNENNDAKAEPIDLPYYPSEKLNSSPSPTNNVLMSQMPKSEVSVCNVPETLPEYDELIALCSGAFDQSLNIRKRTDETYKTFSADLYQNTLNGDDELCQRISKIRQCNIKKHLEFSDDENTNIEAETAVKPFNVTKCGNRNEFPQTSKIQEIIATNDTCCDNDHINKLNESEMCSDKDLFTKCNKESERQKKISYIDFIEDEAELSDIEIFTSSSDEDDDDNLDRYDVELGDEDEYDPEQLQNELANVHAYQVMEEDAQRIRKIHDLFVNNRNDEDGERQRKFRWNNKENNSLTTPEGDGDLGYDGNVDFDLPQSDKRDELLELQWRQMCYERDQFLEAQRMRSCISNGKVLKLHRSRTTDSKKIRIIDGKNCTSAKVKPNLNKPVASFLINKQVNVACIKSSRGSFLKCDQDTLNKLATVTKSFSSNYSNHNNDDITMTNKVMPITAENSKNFVFSTLTTAEHAKLKRKSKALSTDNSSFEEHNGENGKDSERAIGKRAKLDLLTRPKCQIDKLLDPVF